MCTAGKRIFSLIMKTIIVVVILLSTTIGMSKRCLAFDEEAVYSVVDRDDVKVPDDIIWKNRRFSTKNSKGEFVKYILKDKILKIYVDNKLIWQTDRSYFVQDIFVSNIDDDVIKQDARIDGRSKEEIVVLLWKEGRYGHYRPFWVREDETDYSQHVFVYNIENNKVISRWGSSYMGNEAEKMCFNDGLMFLTHSGEKETAWEWTGFGFEKVESVDFFVVGDNLLHEPIYVDALKNHDGKFDHIYRKVEKYTKKADFSVINLETPLVNDPGKYSTYPCFGSPVSVAEAIKKAGFDCVTLSNNHRLDKGKTGVDETLEAIQKYDLLHVGSMDEKPYLLVKRHGIVFALMNYTYGTNGIKPPKEYEKAVNYLTDEEQIRKDIRTAKENSDFVIVFPHWGTEYATAPDTYQKKWRDVFYDEGVDVVCGTHPHVIQPYELYKKEGRDKDMLIYYSLGNYISANGRKDHNSGGFAFFSVEPTSKGPILSKYNFVKSETMFRARDYYSKD